MTFPNQSTLKSAIADLKEVVTRLHGAETDPVRLLSQIESCANEIETKASTPLYAAAPEIPVVAAPVVAPITSQTSSSLLI